MSGDERDREKLLLEDPFNHEVRRAYGNELLLRDKPAEAKKQFELLVRQNHDHHEVYLGLARCWLKEGRPDEALRHYRMAREREGFQPDPELDELEKKTRSTKSFLKVVDGEPGGDLIEFRPSGPERIGFEDIAGMDDLKKTLRLQIIEPFLRPELFAKFKKKAGGGILLYGPPGCGKTMISRAIATECRAFYLAIGIGDILNMWMGESEKNMAQMFEKARANKPAVLFFDELDALAFSRSKARSEHTRTIVNEFLAQLDNVENRNDQVLILAATNMPWDVDQAMKRPGRFSRMVLVPPPDVDARTNLFQMRLRDLPADAIDFKALAKMTRHCSGADIDGIIEQAKEAVLAEICAGGPERNLKQDDLAAAISRHQPTTLEWLNTARNLVKYAGADDSYRDLEAYLRKEKLL